MRVRVCVCVCVCARACVHTCALLRTRTEAGWTTGATNTSAEQKKYCAKLPAASAAYLQINSARLRGETSHAVAPPRNACGKCVRGRLVAADAYARVSLYINRTRTRMRMRAYGCAHTEPMHPKCAYPYTHNRCTRLYTFTRVHKSRRIARTGVNRHKTTTGRVASRAEGRGYY
jgi:hypothetical protein